MELGLDEVSIKILALLQENSRMSFTEIGKEVTLSSSAVADRVKKLEELGILEGYTIKVNHKALGLGIKVIIKIDFPGKFTLEEKKIIEEIKNIPEILEYYRVTGANDCIIKVVVASVEHLSQLIEKLGTFGKIDTSLVTYEFVTRNSINFKEILKT